MFRKLRGLLDAAWSPLLLLRQHSAGFLHQGEASKPSAIHCCSCIRCSGSVTECLSGLALPDRIVNFTAYYSVDASHNLLGLSCRKSLKHCWLSVTQWHSGATPVANLISFSRYILHLNTATCIIRKLYALTNIAPSCSSETTLSELSVTMTLLLRDWSTSLLLPQKVLLSVECTGHYWRIYIYSYPHSQTAWRCNGYTCTWSLLACPN